MARFDKRHDFTATQSSQHQYRCSCMKNASMTDTVFRQRRVYPFFGVWAYFDGRSSCFSTQTSGHVLRRSCDHYYVIVHTVTIPFSACIAAPRSSRPVSTVPGPLMIARKSERAFSQTSLKQQDDNGRGFVGIDEGGARHRAALRRDAKIVARRLGAWKRTSAAARLQRSFLAEVQVTGLMMPLVMPLSHATESSLVMPLSHP
jgi:hypothetical protein